MQKKFYIYGVVVYFYSVFFSCMSSRKQHAIVVDVFSSSSSLLDQESRLRECQSLITTLGTIHVARQLQSSADPKYKTYLQTSMIDRIFEICRTQKITVIILNNILKSRQIFALTEMFQPHGIQVWDRIDLILNIFSAHAQSAEAKLQIDLARIRHMGPRIFGMGDELSRQGGGIGTSGIGETNTEIMKRHLKKQEDRIVQKLKKVQQTKSLQRQRRERQHLKTVALVGYTNAGKSTLMQRLTKKQYVEVNDALFVTLQTRTGKLFLPDTLQNVLVSDTIGFIADLPPKLISAFTSTLSEAIHADLLLHVVDVSDPQRAKKIEVVDEILENLGLDQKPQILVCNKTDMAGKRFGKIKLRKQYKFRTPLFVSAQEKEGLAELKTQIGKVLFPPQRRIRKQRGF